MMFVMMEYTAKRLKRGSVLNPRPIKSGEQIVSVIRLSKTLSGAPAPVIF